MIFDFPEIKAKFEKQANIHLRQKIYEKAPLISNIGKRYQHEGKGMQYETKEGTKKTVEYKQFETTTTIKREDVRSLKLPQIVQQLEEMAEEFAADMERTAFDSLNKELESAGQTMGAKPFTHDTFLEALDKLEIDFDEATKQPLLPKLYVGPELAKQLAKEMPEWEKNEEYSKKYNDLIKKKYDEWLLRKNDRELAE